MDRPTYDAGGAGSDPFIDDLVRYFMSLPPPLRKRILDEASGRMMGPGPRMQPMPYRPQAGPPVLGGPPEPPIPPSNGPPVRPPRTY